MISITTAVALTIAGTSLAQATPLAINSVSAPSCDEALETLLAAQGLALTGWKAASGPFPRLDLRGIHEAADSEPRKYFVFDQKNGPPRIFREMSRNYVKDTLRERAMSAGGGRFSTYFYEAVLQLVGADGELAPTPIEVKIEAENDGFRLETWNFVLDGEPNQVLFYDTQAEALHREKMRERRVAEAARDRITPERGTKAWIRQEIVNQVIAEGRNPSEQHWIDDEADRQWKEMWHDLGR